MKLVSQRSIRSSVFPVALFTVAKNGNNPCPWMNEKIRKMWYIYIMYYMIFSLKKARNPVIWGNMDEPEGPYVMWDKWAQKDNSIYIHGGGDRMVVAGGMGRSSKESGEMLNRKNNKKIKCIWPWCYCLNHSVAPHSREQCVSNFQVQPGVGLKSALEHVTPRS